MRGSDVWAEKEQLLTSVPGVGKTIARTLICRAAGIGNARPPKDCGSCRARAVDAPVRAMARKKLYRRRSKKRARLLIRRRYGLPRVIIPYLNSSATNSSQAKAPRSHRRRSKGGHYPQRNPAR
jgi:hypothetical protein